MGDRYDIHIPAVRKPKFKIFDINERYSEQDLIDVIKNQNEALKDSEIEVMKIYENKQLNNFGAIVEFDDESANNIKKLGKLNIGWNRCRIENFTSIRRCYKSADCKNKIACLKCSVEHISKDCKSNICKCINCDTINRKYKTKYDANHPAWSKKCPIYMKRVKSELSKEEKTL